MNDMLEDVAASSLHVRIWDNSGNDKLPNHFEDRRGDWTIGRSNYNTNYVYHTA